ncbi:MAG: agmatine/peptidylarginine deiminase [Sandaracinaceae bacterium]
MTGRTPRARGFSPPPEWAPHDGVWLAWPSHDDLWGEHFEGAQTEFIAFCEAIADLDEQGRPRGETLQILVPNGTRHLEASARLEHLAPRLHRIPFGDIWMRDIAPIFVRNDAGEIAAVSFAFNGWGNKYVLDGDEMVASRVAEQAGCEHFAFGFVLEGGALEHDGQGTFLTTRSCLLNPNRNPGMELKTIEHQLGEALGARKVLWLDDGLLHDHTDGHIDTLVRFIEPGRVLCMAPSGDDDPNRAVLEAIAKDLARMRDAEGRALSVERIPSPGLVKDDEGTVMPASYANFYVANTTVAVPTYGTPYDDAVLARLGELFQGRRVVGCPSKTILMGGGALHCISQQEPLRSVQ